MLERYNERARRVLHFARFEAMQSGSASIDGGHLLLALMRLREPGGMIGEIFDRRSLTLEQVRNEIESALPDRHPRAPDVLLDDHAFGEDARQILEFAEEEATRMGHTAVDAEHLLVGILLADQSTAAAILKARGFRLDEIRGEIDVLRSQPPPSPGVYVKPATRPSRDGAEIGTDDAWALEGFDLITALSTICKSEVTPFPSTRIELPASLDPSVRYDFHLVLGPHDRRADRSDLMRRGVETHFGVRVEREDRLMDVYVLTAPGDRGAAAQPLPPDDGGFVSSSFAQFSLSDLVDGPPTLESLKARFPTLGSLQQAIRAASMGRLSLSNGTMAEFCSTLEPLLDRPVVDETGLDGRHDIELPDGPGDLAERLRRELGFELTPARRPVTWIVVRENA